MYLYKVLFIFISDFIPIGLVKYSTELKPLLINDTTLFLITIFDRDLNSKFPISL